MTAKMYYDNDADPQRPGRADGRDHRVWQPGPRPCAEPARERGRRHRRPGAGVQEPRARLGRRPAGQRRRGCRPRCRRRDDPRARHLAEGRLRRRDRPAPARRPPPDVRPRLQPALRADRPAGDRGRGDGRAQGTRSPAALRVPGGRRRAGPVRGRARPVGHRRATACSPMPGRSARRAPACSRPRSPRRPRPTSSASSRCCAAAPRRS